jgi:hypothetical protein
MAKKKPETPNDGLSKKQRAAREKRDKEKRQQKLFDR